MSGSQEILPELTVVIPTLGRDMLIRTLESLAAAVGFHRLEVIVAGRVSDADTAAQIREFKERHTNVFHLDIQYEKGDSSRKKNAGAGVARAPLIAFLDDDVVVAPDWPQRIVEPFADPNVGLASGPSLVPDDINRIGRLAGLALSSKAVGYVADRYRQRQDAIHPVDWDRIIGCNAIYRREAFMQMGGFPAEYYPGEEMIAAYRTERAGWRLVFAPAAWVKHYPRQSLARFWRQMWTYGATRIRLLRGGVSFNLLPLVPGFWVGGTIALAFLAPLVPWAARLLALELAIYALAALGVTLETAVKTRRIGDLWLWTMIPWMHVAYGLAEWVELVRPDKDFSLGR